MEEEIDWNDKEQVLEAVKENGWNLKYASEELQGDKEVVLEALFTLEYYREIDEPRALEPLFSVINWRKFIRR